MNEKFIMADRLTRNRVIANVLGVRKVYVRSRSTERQESREENQSSHVAEPVDEPGVQDVPIDESTDFEISIGMNNMSIGDGE